MKVLHYSDQPAPDFLKLYSTAQILITTGDLSLFDFPGLEDMKNKIPAFGVYGNHDSGQYLEKLGIINLHNKVYDYAGLTWGGFEGCIKYKESGIMYTENEAEIWAENFPRVDVLLLHAGPLGLLDDPGDEVHTGSAAVKRYVIEKKPKFVFCGHQYSNDQMQSESTRFYRTFGARILDLVF
jgi:Icc-related predicted phosphoesterase